MNSNDLKDLISKILGIILILLGIIGLFLPGLQGIAMILGGIYLLHNKWINQKIKLIKTYFKKGRGK